MFWRERERENKEPNSGPPCGQVRVLVVGDSAVGDWKEESSQPAEPCITPTGSLSGQVTTIDQRWSTNHDGGISQADQGLDWGHSGVGKTSFVHLIMKGSSISRPSQTVGCTVSVKHTTYGSSGSSSNSIKGDSERDFFVELWDVSGHERYKDCRSLFYSQINGVIFVYDLSQRKTKASLQKWAADVAATGTFSAPLGSGGPGGLPVPYIVVGNKADIIAKEGPRGSSGNLVDVARQWVEKQGLLPSSEELPLTESFPGTGSLLAAAKEARYDKEAVMKFFRTLIRRRYFPDEVPASNPWSVTPVQRTIQSSSEILSDDDHFRKTPSFSGDPYNYNVMPPLPAQRNLTPPPTLNPQQPVSMSETYSLPRFSFTGSLDNSNTRSRRMDINV